MFEERRRFSLIAFEVPADLTVGGSKFTVHEVRNLSVGGGLMQIGEKLPLGSTCTIKLYIDGTVKGLRIYIDGEVVRSEESTVSIQFSQIGPGWLFYLQNIVKYCQPILKFCPEFRSHLK